MQPFRPASLPELAHIARWNGPSVDSWTAWLPSPEPESGGWFLMAELPVHLTRRQQALLRDTARGAGLRTAAVFYDAIPWKMRALYPAAVANAHFDYMAELAVYDRVLAISEHARRDLTEILSGQSDRLNHVVACPLPGEFPGGTRPGTRLGKAAVSKAVRILSVGSVEPRKNHERLLTALELARTRPGPPLSLTLAGGAHGLDPDLADRVRARVSALPDVTWIEQPSDAQLASLYEACDFTVYPSLEEGFGMPILESLWYGKPVVCASFGAMAEVAEGGGCLPVDTADTEALSDAIWTLASDAELRQHLTEAARGRTFRSWRDYADDVAGRLGLRPLPVA